MAKRDKYLKGGHMADFDDTALAITNAWLDPVCLRVRMVCVCVYPLLPPISLAYILRTRRQPGKGRERQPLARLAVANAAGALLSCLERQPLALRRRPLTAY